MSKRIGCCLVFALVLPFSGHSMAQDRVYRNGIDPNFPPFTYVDKYGVSEGFDVKALDWIAREIGFRVEHLPMPWDDIIKVLKKRDIDIIASGLSITEERKEQVNFTIPYWTIKPVIVARQDSVLTVGQILDKGNKLGVQRGTTEAKWIEEHLVKKGVKKCTLVYFDSTPLAVEAVVKGRIAGAAMDDAPARDAARKRPVKIVGGFGMADERFGYAVRKEDTRLLEMLNEGLTRLMGSPHWAELKKKYELE
ncbi:MAG: ABC transporter substrate-binding protein [Thermodesulfobacteriota bacterium]